MTRGRGFIGLAAMIVGRWSPLGAFGAALLFRRHRGGQSIKLIPPAGDLGHVSAIPGQFYDALPYLVTIVVLAGVVGRSIPPAADGQPYEREAAHLTRALDEAGASATEHGANLDLQEAAARSRSSTTRGSGRSCERHAGSRSSGARPTPAAPRTA